MNDLLCGFGLVVGVICGFVMLAGWLADIIVAQEMDKEQ